MTTDRAAYAAGLRALADLLDAHPDLSGTYMLNTVEDATADLWREAFQKQCVPYTESADDHSRVVTGSLHGLMVRIVHVYPEIMDHYAVEREFVREQAAVIDARYEATKATA